MAKRGISAHYHTGDKNFYTHLRFDSEEDALVYILVNGGEILLEPPYKDWINYDD